MDVAVTGPETELGNNGILLRIADTRGAHVGKLRIGRGTVEWCRGKVHIGNGRKIPLSELIEILNAL